MKVVIFLLFVFLVQGCLEQKSESSIPSEDKNPVVIDDEES